MTPTIKILSYDKRTSIWVATFDKRASLATIIDSEVAEWLVKHCEASDIEDDEKTTHYYF